MKGKKILYLVFNKMNQLEAEEKFGKSVKCSTTNSFGHNILKENGYKFDKYKRHGIIKKYKNDILDSKLFYDILN